MKWKRIVNIPVLYFTTEFSKSGRSRGIHFSAGNLSSASEAQDAEEDLNLNRSSFVEGLGRWIELMACSEHSTIAEAASDWQKLLDRHLLKHVPGPEGWEVEREYVSILRRVAIPVGPSPVEWDSEEIWFEARKAARTKEISEHFTKWSSTLELSHGAAKSFRTGGVSSARTSIPEESQRSARFDKRESKPSSKASAPDNAQSHTQLCFACGRRSHLAKNCSAETQAGGRNLFIYRNENQQWVLPGNERFCFAFNGAARSCQGFDDCPKGKHICTLCAARGHGAMDCPKQ